MIIASLTATSPYPSERFFIAINPIEPALDNARVGTRFIYSYYNTGEEKLIITPTPSLSSSTETFTQPTCFVSLPDSFPVTWTPGHDKQYAFISFLGATSAITVYPSQPYPKITKIDNNTVEVSANILPYQYFDYEIHREDFRKQVDINDLTNGNSFLFSSTPWPVYTSRSFRNYPLYLTKNNKTNLTTYVPKGIVDNSFKIEVPLVSTADQEDVWYYSMHDITSTNNSVIKSTGTLVGMYMEDISGAGIPFPYTTTNSINYTTGKIVLNSRSPLLFPHDEFVTITCETSSKVTNNSVASSQTLSPNRYRLRSTLPIYFYNFPFKASGTGYSTQDAFTISFMASSVVIDTQVSAVQVSSYMLDNYYQTKYPINVNKTRAVKRFVERTEDYSLSAYDMGTNILYKNMQWMPASATMKFINDGLGNNYTAGIQLSTFTGALYEDYNDINFILNGDNIIFNLNITEQTDLSARVAALIFPSADETLPVKWDVFPPENIVLRNPNTGEIIERNTFYPGDTFDVDVFNLGVDRTKITLYSQEYNVSAQTFWFPSSAIYSDISLSIQDSISDRKQIKTGTLSAMVSRNGALYRAPETANIIWRETLNDPRGNMEFDSGDGQFPIIESSVYPSTNNYSLINVSATTQNVVSDPKNITFNINCGLFNESFSIETNKLINLREYPSDKQLTIDFKNSANNIVRNTEFNDSIVYVSPGTMTLSAVYPDLIIADTSLNWYVSANTFVKTGTGTTILFPLTSNVTVSLIGLNGKPFYGNFKAYEFEENLSIFYSPSAIPFSYIAFPENSFFTGNTLNFNNFTQTHGTTSYKPCHTENFYLSASPGFTEYVWTIGQVTTLTNGNTNIMGITYGDVSATGNVYVSAFNSIFSETGFSSIYNTASSNSSNLYRNPVTFLDYPAISSNIELTNDVVDTGIYQSLPVLFGTITPSQLVSNYNINVVLSGSTGIQSTPLNSNLTDFSKIIKIGTDDTPFIINEDSFNTFNVFLSGTVNEKIQGYDFCDNTVTVVSNSIPITAFNGPSLNLYISSPILSVNEVGEFLNLSNINFGTNSKAFSAFIFDPGNGILTVGGLSSLSASYASAGYYSPSLTGIRNDGSIVEETWIKFVYVTNTFETYDSNINRELQFDLTIPYGKEELFVSPNEWQYASTINKSLVKIDNMIQHISSNSFAYNILFPKTLETYLTDRFGNFKWTSRTPNEVPKTTFLNLKSIQVIGTKMLCINEDRIEIYDISEAPTLVFSTNKLGESEILRSPSKILYEGDNLFILDSQKNTFYVCDFDIDNSNEIKLTNYWGGVGGRTDRTKLNLPTDFDIDVNGNIYIVDSIGYIIKVYNKYLNWIQNIEFSFLTPNVRPNSISITDEGVISITTSNGKTFILAQGKEIVEIFVENSHRSILNNYTPGLVYILSGNIIHKYTTAGTFISNQAYSSNITDVAVQNHDLFISLVDVLVHTSDFIETLSIFEPEYSGFPMESILVKEYEFVTDYIFNDSFKKLRDNISILNNNIQNKFVIELDEYNDVQSLSISSAPVPELTKYPIYLATNEPVLYDTINRSVGYLYDNLVEVYARLNVVNTVPDNADSYKWSWKSHYIDSTQYPSLFKNPVSWRELQTNQLIDSVLSSVSSWCAIRDDSGGNHSEICWTFQQLQCNSLYPMTWEDLECSNTCSRVFTWEDFERDCCIFPDYVFADKVSAC